MLPIDFDRQRNTALKYLLQLYTVTAVQYMTHLLYSC